MSRRPDELQEDEPSQEMSEEEDEFRRAESPIVMSDTSESSQIVLNLQSPSNLLDSDVHSRASQIGSVLEKTTQMHM